jgi:hypothetical protein
MDFQIKFVRISLEKWKTNEEKHSIMFIHSVTEYYKQNVWQQHAGMRPAKQTKQIKKSSLHRDLNPVPPEHECRILQFWTTSEKRRNRVGTRAGS